MIKNDSVTAALNVFRKDFEKLCGKGKTHAGLRVGRAMIDLHLHFDGSLLARTVLELAKEQGIALPSEEPDELKLFLAAPADCGSLNEYLENLICRFWCSRPGKRSVKGCIRWPAP